MAVTKDAVIGSPPDRVMASRETAQLLGVSERTLLRMRGLPKVRLSPGRVGYPRLEVLDWIASRRIAA